VTFDLERFTLALLVIAALGLVVLALFAIFYKPKGPKR
jgi:hypothetical protein